LQHLIGSLGPDERLGILVVDDQVVLDGGFEFASGAEVVFDRLEDNTYKIYKMDSDGTDQMPLTDDIDCLDPDGAPNGLKIAFLCVDPEDGFEVCVIRPDGTGLTRLTENSNIENNPSWNAASSRVVYAKNTNGYWDIWVIDANGSNETQITSSNEDNKEPDWR
jgi:Tol biopolymer transport system component